MSSKTRVVQPFYCLLGSAAVVVVIAGLRAAQSLVVPFLIAAFIAVICTPALHWLQQKRVPSWVAILLVALAVSMIALVVVAIMTGSINGFLNKMPTYQQKLQEKQENFTNWFEELTASKVKPGAESNPEGTQSNQNEVKSSASNGKDHSTVSDNENLKPSPNIGSESDQGSQTIVDRLMEKLSTRAVFSYVGDALLGLTSIFSNMFLVLLTVLFMLLESSGFPNKLRALSDRTENLDMLDQAEKIRASIVSYMSLKTVLSLLTSVLVGIFVKFLNIDFPVLWAMLAFFLNYIPNIGSIMAAVLPVLLALIQHDWKIALITAAGYAVINVVIGNVLEPRIMGKGLGLSTLVVFVSLVFWGWVLGPVGMLFSVPLTMIVKIIMENFEETRWLAILVGANPEASE